MIDSVFHITEDRIIKNNIQIIKELSSQDKIHTYINEVKQVILNLLKNAEDALMDKQQDNPIIKIVTYKYKNMVVLEVSDNAGGIPEDIIDKIFDPYFSTKEEKNGTGLGLYMSRTIIEEHCGGTLTVTNNKDGAVFKIMIKGVRG
jgi:C4-dicarboxylate-specific signal transduction histidine kinase